MATDNQALQLRLQDALRDAQLEDSIPNLRLALEAARSDGQEAFGVFVEQTFHTCIQFNDGGNTLLPCIEYLLSNTEVRPSILTTAEISSHPSIALFELLLRYGWDVNAQDERNETLQGRRIIDWVCDDYQLVEWLADHGARIDGAEEVSLEQSPQSVPLLETCAMVGSLKTFRFLESKGATMGRRTLHQACGAAAVLGVDPSTTSPGQIDPEFENRAERGAVLRYLVDEMRLDVNAMDTDVPRGSLYFGAPINYAAREKLGGHVVKWLLEKGADPGVESLDEIGLNAWGYAQMFGCEDVLEILRAWGD